jgi:predicted nucleic acid-binding protein
VTRAFFDSNVLIYTIEQGTARSARAAALLADGGFISVQCLNEFVSVLSRKLKLDWPAIVEARDQLVVLCALAVPMTLDIHVNAVEIAHRLRLSLWDALIVSAALSVGCSTLYSEDMHHGLVIAGTLTIVNPFLG